MCPDNYVCDGSHNCVMEGATLIKEIHLTTGTCSGCSTSPDQEGGAKLHIEGIRHNCTTRGLDKQTELDYAAGNTADFMSREDAEIMAQCNNAEIGPSGPKTTTIEWTGVGTWTPQSVVLEVSGSYQYNCKLPSPPPSLSQGDKPVLLQCEFA